ncbi:MAG: HAD-IA family hydrolase [Vitreoscilla sp.]|nr:HAD-IA family hydrolase [Vitreoscilla sp.]
MRTTLLFDFGRVLVDFDFGHAFAAWARADSAETSRLQAAFVQDEEYCAHERGEITWPQYADHLRRRLSLKLDDSELLNGWNAIFTRPVAGIEAKIALLTPNHRLFVLSNTNAAHYDFWSSHYSDLLRPFKQLLCSHALGARKPELAVYLRALEAMNCDASDVLFFDDVEVNVEGAKRAGIDSRVFRTVDDIPAPEIQ